MSAGVEDLVVSRTGWARFQGRRLRCALGRGALRTDKREGDGATPIGRFRFEAVLFRPDRARPPVRSGLPATAVRTHHGWSDDAADPEYNNPVERPHGFGHERLWRSDALYDLVVVFDANRAPIQAGRGSALFLHAWRRARFPTAGCVAFDPADLRWIVNRLTPRATLMVCDA